MALVDVSTLARQLAEPGPPTVIDVRWKLGGPPVRGEYLAGHLPGAVFLDLDRDVSGPPGAGGRHPLPQPDALEQALRTAGVRAGHPVVVYDAGDGMAAARLWWTLRWAGHDQVSVLDGGLAAWVAEGHALQDGTVTAGPGDVVVRPGGMPVVDADGAAQLARSGMLLDVRAPERYRGEHEPIDPVPGHIPGAVNLPASTLVGEGGRLRPPDELRQAVEAAVRSRVVARKDALQSSRGLHGVLPSTAPGAYCGSGVAAAHTVLALELAGFAGAPLYVGSWSDWIADPSRPVATGDQP